MSEKREREEEEEVKKDDKGCGFNPDAITSSNADNIGDPNCISDSKDKVDDSKKDDKKDATADDDDEGDNDNKNSAITGSATKKQKTKPTVCF